MEDEFDISWCNIALLFYVLAKIYKPNNKTN